MHMRMRSQLLKKAPLMGAFFIGLLGLPAQAACPLPGHLPVFEVKRVFDGDTLRLADGRNVRLIGLNTPELSRQGRAAQPFAVKAQKRLEQLIRANAGQVALKIGEPAKDHYGRLLAHAFADNGRNIEEQLLAEGLGYQVVFAPATRWAQCQQMAERRAREEGRGLWRQPRLLTPAQVDSGGFALIRGKVLRVERNRGGIWLEMGDSVVLQVTPKLFPHFDIEGLQALAGRQIEARGWVVDRARRGQLKKGQARWLLPISADFMLEEVR